MSTSLPPPTPHEIKDGRRIIRFTGTPIAQASSERPHAPRFVVLTLYQLPSPPPAYVLSRIGHSRVFHTADCHQAARNRLPFGHETQSPAAAQDLHPCPYCIPTQPIRQEDPTPLDFLTQHRFETPRHFGAILPTADELIRLLNHSAHASRTPPVSPSSGLYELPWLSRQLLDSAAPHDPALQTAYNVTIP